MDPNGCVPSLKGLGVDLSTVKQLVHLPRGEEGGGGELGVTGLNPNPCRKQLRRRHASAFYADLWLQKTQLLEIALFVYYLGPMSATPLRFLFDL